MNYYQDVEVIVMTPLYESLILKVYTQFGAPMYIPLIVNVSNPTIVVDSGSGGSVTTTVVVNLPPLLATPPGSQTQEVDPLSP